MHLLEESEKLRRDGADLLDDFMVNGPFNAEWSAKDALASIKDFRKQLLAIREREAQIRRDLGLFDISLPESLELARLERVCKVFFELNV